MARLRRRFGVRSGRAVRRKFVWSRLNHDFGAAAPTGAVDLLSDYRTVRGITANDPGLTAVRIRGSVQAEFEAAGSFSHISGIVHGIYVDTLGSVAALPLGFPHEDWLFWEYWPASRNENIGATNTDRIIATEIDAKSMRKLEEVQQTLYYIWEVVGTPANAEVFCVFSVGVKLP